MDSGVVHCIGCGSDRFRAGQIVPSLEGGYDLVMPCAECGTPNKALHEEDLDLAKGLIQFFGATRG